MAHKNKDYSDLSKFNNRLLELMILSDLSTARKLATALYNKKLVNSNSSPSFTILVLKIKDQLMIY